jgi:hypothetical protein
LESSNVHRLLIWGTLLTSLAAAQVNVSAPTQVIFPASKFTCAGPAPTVCTLYDDTPATGASTLTIRAGPAQAGINLFNIYANDGVTAGLHVDSSRQVGIGTAAPSGTLHLIKGGALITTLDSYGSSIRIRMRKWDGTVASPTAIQATDEIAYLPLVQGYDGSALNTLGYILYTAAETFSGTQLGTRVTFNAVPGGQSKTAVESFIEYTDTGNLALVQTSGNVGIGTAAPGYLLDVAKGTGLTARFQDQTATTGDTHVLIDIGAAETASSEVFRINGVMRFGGTNTTGAGAALLGNNSPATVAAAPYTWFRALAADGTVVFIPAWK